MRYKILAYRTRFTYRYGARGDVLYKDMQTGEVRMRENVCLCGWCAKSCRFQKEITKQVLEKKPQWVRCGRQFSHIYLKGTRGKWVIIESDDDLAISSNEEMQLLVRLFELAYKDEDEK